MNFYKTIFSSFLLTIGFVSSIQAQVDKDSELFKTLKSNDSLLFEVSFNQCKLAAIDNIIADDLEFYHDQGGVTNSKEKFMEVMKKGICSESNTTKSRRELVPNSLDVYPLYSNGALYGALQNGEHQFYESYNSQPEVSGSIAKFSHLWLKEGDNWMLKRVISFDHKMPKSK